LPAAALADNDAVSSRQRAFWQIELQMPDVKKTAQLVQRRCPVAVLSAATGGDLARSVRWDQLLGPCGLGDELRVGLVADRAWWGSLTLYREKHSPRFTADDVAALARLAGPIARVARAAWTADPPRGGAHDDAPGTLLVTAEGRQVSATAAAERWLDRLGPGQRRSGTLIHALAARLGETMDPYHPLDCVRSVVRGLDGGWIQLDASRLDTPDGSGTVAITVQAARPEAVADLLVQAFALTDRERQVADLALAGRSTAEIGARLFLSRHTVGDHLKAIFAKTGVHSRAELAQRLTGQPC